MEKKYKVKNDIEQRLLNLNSVFVPIRNYSDD